MQGLEDLGDDLEVSEFGVTAEVIGLARLAMVESCDEGLAVVADVKPVADLGASAVNGQRLAIEGFFDNERDEFFRELIRSVVVRAIGGDGWDAVGLMIGADEVIAGGFGGRVRAVGLVGVLFGKGGGIWCERAEDFVRGDVEKAEVVLFGGVGVEVVAGGLEEVEGAEDVGVDEVSGGVDGAVDMGLGSEVKNGVEAVFFKELSEEGGVLDIALDEVIARIVRDRVEVAGVAGVGKEVEVDEGVDF